MILQPPISTPFPTRRSSDLISTSSQKEPLSESVDLRLMARRAFLDFLDGRRNDWRLIFRVMKFQMHAPANEIDRKSTRLNSSHANISYAVFCLKKKKKKQ